MISLYAKGLTTGEIQAHSAEIYDTSASRETTSETTGEIAADMAVRQNRPLEPVYAVLLIDAITVKVRDSQVANRPVHVATGVDLAAERDALALWLGPVGGEDAKHQAAMLGELRNRGPADALIVCCDGLKGPARPDPGDLARRDRAHLRGAHGPQQPALRLQDAPGALSPSPCRPSTPPPPPKPPRPPSRPSPKTGNTPARP